MTKLAGLATGARLARGAGLAREYWLVSVPGLARELVLAEIARRGFGNLYAKSRGIEPDFTSDCEIILCIVE